MAKNRLDMKSMKDTKKKIENNLRDANKTLLDFSEDMIKETVKTGEAWQAIISKAIKNSEPLMKKQSDIIYDTVKGMKDEANHGMERFEKLTGYDLSDIKNSLDVEMPKPPKWMVKGFEYLTDQTEELLQEVAKRGEDIVDSVSDTAKNFAKEAEDLRDKAEARVKEVIKDVETRISDIAPKTKEATDKKKSTTKVSPKKSEAKASTSKTAPKKSSTKKAVVKKEVTKAQTKPDDLKIIEGVGPKLEGLLNEAGYMTYKDVANATVADLQKILDQAGTRYKVHNPKTWPLQADLAGQGKMEELKQWQANNNAQKA